MQLYPVGSPEYSVQRHYQSAKGQARRITSSACEQGSKRVITVVYPELGATFAVGCERYPEGAIPTEIKERPEGTKIDELTFWSI
jgi:hypothetical protein